MTLLKSIPTLTSLSFDKTHKPFNAPLLGHVKYHPTLVILDTFKQFESGGLPNIIEARVGARVFSKGGAKDLYALDRLPNLVRLQLCRVGGRVATRPQQLPFKFPPGLNDLELSFIPYDDSILHALSGLWCLQKLTMLNVPMETALCVRLARCLAQTAVKVLRFPHAVKSDSILVSEFLLQGRDLAFLDFRMVLVNTSVVPDKVLQMVKRCVDDAELNLSSKDNGQRQIKSYIINVCFSTPLNPVQKPTPPLIWSG